MDFEARTRTPFLLFGLVTFLGSLGPDRDRNTLDGGTAPPAYIILGAPRVAQPSGATMPESTHISPGEGVNARLGAPQPTSLEERKSPLESTMIMQVKIIYGF